MAAHADLPAPTTNDLTISAPSAPHKQDDLLLLFSTNAVNVLHERSPCSQVWESHPFNRPLFLDTPNVFKMLSQHSMHNAHNVFVKDWDTSRVFECEEVNNECVPPLLL